MAIVAKGKVTSTAPGGYFGFGVSAQVNGRIDVIYGKTTTASSPWAVTLYSEQFSASGKLLEKLSPIAKYTAPSDDPAGTTTFELRYSELELSSTLRAVLWTQPVGDYSTDKTEIEMQLLNSAGKKENKPVTLAIAGKSTSVTDLYRVSFSALAGFGKSFEIVYSTFNSATLDSQVRYEIFSDSGKAEKGGVIASYTDHFHHGPAFGSYFVEGNSSKRCYLEMNFAAGNLAQMYVRTFTPSGDKGPFHLTFNLAGPGGDAVSGLNSYNFVRPGASHTKDNYGVLTETFNYLNGNDYEIALQTLNAAGHITHKTEFTLPEAPKSYVSFSAQICHVDNGDIVVGYNAGGSSYLQEYNSSLKAIGGAIAISPSNSTGDLDSLVSLGGDRFEAFWRQDSSTSILQNKLHSEIFTATA